MRFAFRLVSLCLHSRLVRGPRSTAVGFLLYSFLRHPVFSCVRGGASFEDLNADNTLVLMLLLPRDERVLGGVKKHRFWFGWVRWCQ